MDIDALVMTAATKYKVYATGSETHAGPHEVDIAFVTFPDVEQAETFAAACMGDGVPAKTCGLIDGEPAVVVMG